MITVCIPTYNPEKEVLCQAIESVYQQSISDFQIIVVDDCSENDVQEFVNGIGDERLEYTRNDENLGLVGNWNRCLELADREYVHLLHDDDTLHPKSFELLLNVIAENNHICAVGGSQTASESFDPSFPDPPSTPRYRIYEPDGISDFIVETGSYLPCSSVLFRRNAIDDVGGFSERFPHSPDEELWSRILNEGHAVGKVEYPIVFRYLSGDNYQFGSWNQDDFIPQYRELHHQLIEYSGHDERVIKAVNKKLSRSFLRIATRQLYVERSVDQALRYYRAMPGRPSSDSSLLLGYLYCWYAVFAGLNFGTRFLQKITRV